jgi:predicted methyltransferase
MAKNYDLRDAVNAISDIVQNRPPPIREVDQIYMKVADMVIQAEYTARVLDGQDVIFIGDGDSIGLSMAHLRGEGVIDYGPRSILVVDFDERIVTAIARFAEKYEIRDVITSQLYNVVDPLPENIVGTKDAFYTNPPWGASNDGESVHVFVERGIEALKPNGLVSGVIVIADDEEVQWTQDVLRSTQRLAIEHKFVIGDMLRELHLYHLDDAPDLRSCSLLIRRLTDVAAPVSRALEASRMYNFYGRDNPLTIKYIRDLHSLNYGKAPDNSYKIELLEVTK